MKSHRLRGQSKSRDDSNAFLNTPQGALKYAGDIVDMAAEGQIEPAARKALAIIEQALKDKGNLKEPALWLRRANLLQMDPQVPDYVKIHASERAVRMLELSLKNKFTGIETCDPMHLSCMLGLAFSAERQQRPDLSLRFLAVIDQLDPADEISVETREQLRERCTPVTVRPYIAPPHRNAISPSAIPGAIFKR